jgi:hypothetical protein
MGLGNWLSKVLGERSWIGVPPDTDQGPAVMSARDLSLSATRVPAPDSRPSFSVTLTPPSGYEPPPCAYYPSAPQSRRSI